MGTGTAGEGMTPDEYMKAMSKVEAHLQRLRGDLNGLREELDRLRKFGADVWETPRGYSPLSADDLAYLDRSWSARLAPLDAEIQEEVRRLSTTPLVELVEALEEG